MAHPKILVFSPYFGPWPVWMDFFVESCKWNESVDWLILSDQPPPENQAPNVEFRRLDFDTYKQQVSDRLGIRFQPSGAYKLCDLRPFFGLLHERDLEGYDFWGYCDNDLVFGDVRAIYDEQTLAHDVLSTHVRKLSGHFALIRNSQPYREACYRIPEWRSLLEADEHLALDESKFSKVFLRHKKHPRWLRKAWGLFDSYQRNTCFVERYSTILAPMPWLDGREDHPEVWFWEKGHLRNERDGDREFLYLHFMNWKSDRWLHGKQRERGAAWAGTGPELIKTRYDNPRQGWMMSRKGFEDLP